MGFHSEVAGYWGVTGEKIMNRRIVLVCTLVWCIDFVSNYVVDPCLDRLVCSGLGGSCIFVSNSAGQLVRRRGGW